MIVLVSERTHTSVFLNDWPRVRECVGSVLWQWVRDMAESQSILRYAMQSDPPRRSEPVRRAARLRAERRGTSAPGRRLRKVWATPRALAALPNYPRRRRERVRLA